MNCICCASAPLTARSEVTARGYRSESAPQWGSYRIGFMTWTHEGFHYMRGIPTGTDRDPTKIQNR